MKRLLCIVGGMNIGGAETFLMKVYRNIDRSKYQMDFAVGIEDEGAYDKEIKQLGGRIYHIRPKSKGLLRNLKDIKRLVKTQKYDYVLRTSQNSLSALELMAAKLGGAKRTIFRSSNSNVYAGRFDRIMHRLCGFMPKRFADIKLAPSTEAAVFMFGKKNVNKGKATIMHNAIDYNLFRYDTLSRDEFRRDAGLSDRLIVGHIGRFNKQKNHKFLLYIFKEIKALRNDAVLMLVGGGELEQQIKDEANSLGISDSIIFMGVRKDVNKLLSVMDVMVFPSLFEGMPNTVIEAQASGLPCVISDTITNEARITDCVEFMSLGQSAEHWAEKAIGCAQRKRLSKEKEFADSGYEIKQIADQFCNIVFEG